jgi:hypothetical protein
MREEKSMRIRLMIVVCLVLIAAVHRPVDAQDSADCAGAPVPRLVVGQYGRVTPGSANNMRNQPATSGENIGQIAAGEEFTVFGTPPPTVSVGGGVPTLSEKTSFGYPAHREPKNAEYQRRCQ